MFKLIGFLTLALAGTGVSALGAEAGGSPIGDGAQQASGLDWYVGDGRLREWRLSPPRPDRRLDNAFDRWSPGPDRPRSGYELVAGLP